MKRMFKSPFVYLLVLIFCTATSAGASSLSEDRIALKDGKTEADIHGLTGVGQVHVPCFIKIAPGGELHIQINTNGAAYLEMLNQTNDASEFTLLKYRNGKPNESYDEETAMFEKKDARRMWGFNEKLQQKDPSLLVDEVVIKVNRGLVYACMVQVGADRQDWYNYGGHHADAHHTGTGADPNRPLTVQITGDNPFDDQTKGEFYLGSESEDNSELVPFTVKNGKTLTWDYPADKKVKNVEVRIDAGNGRAKIRLTQPPAFKKEAAKPAKNAQPLAAARPAAVPAAVPAPATASKAAVSVGTGETIFSGDVPIMEGAEVVKEISMGAITQVDLKIQKSPEDVINYYKTTMETMGWQIGVTMVQGSQGMLQLKKEGKLLTLKAKQKGQDTIVNLMMVAQ